VTFGPSAARQPRRRQQPVPALPVSGSRPPRVPVGAAKYRNLVPQHQELDVLNGGCAAPQQDLLA